MVPLTFAAKLKQTLGTKALSFNSTWILYLVPWHWFPLYTRVCVCIGTFSKNLTPFNCTHFTNLWLNLHGCRSGEQKKKWGGRTTRSLTSASWNLIKKYAASNVTEVEMGKIKKIGREFLLEQLPTGEEPQMQFNFNQIAEQLTSKMHSEPHREAWRKCR